MDHEGKSGSKYLMFSHLSSGNIFRTISFGHEIRLSNGWEKGENFLYSFLGYFGISSYHTKTNGKDGSIYFFAGKTTDILNILGYDFYAGVWIRIGRKMSVEYFVDFWG